MITGLKDLSTSLDTLNGNDCTHLRFQEICLYFYLYKFFRERLWSPPPYLKILHIRLQNGTKKKIYPIGLYCKKNICLALCQDDDDDDIYDDDLDFARIDHESSKAYFQTGCQYFLM